MRGARDVLAELERRGCAVRVVGERLLVSPGQALDDDLRAAIRQHKTEILALVTRSATEATDRDGAAGEAEGCPRCAVVAGQAAEVLGALRRHPALPSALRDLPDDRLLILVKWTVVALTNPRPQWPPRPTGAAAGAALTTFTTPHAVSGERW